MYSKENLSNSLLEVKQQRQSADCMVWFLDPFRTWKIVWQCVCLDLSETFFSKIMALVILSRVCTALKKKKRTKTQSRHTQLCSNSRHKQEWWKMARLSAKPQWIPSQWVWWRNKRQKQWKIHFTDAELEASVYLVAKFSSFLFHESQMGMLSRDGFHWKAEGRD